MIIDPGDIIAYTLGWLHPTTLSKLREQRIVIAGGAIVAAVLGNHPRDLDMFLRNPDVLEPCPSRAGVSIETSDKGECIPGAQHHLHLQPEPEIYPVIDVCRSSNDAAAIIAEFPFTVTAAAVYLPHPETETCGWYGWKFICHPFFFRDLEDRVLRYNRPPKSYDGRHTNKYLSRGYKLLGR